MARLCICFCLLTWLTACEKDLVGDPRWVFYSPASTGLLEDGQPDLEGELLFNQGDLYVAGYVLLRFDGDEWTSLYRNAPADYYTALAFAPNNQLWMARRSVDAGTTSLQYYENESWTTLNLPASFATLLIRDFYFETAERFWMATNGGLLQYSNGGWSLQNTGNSSLPHNDLHRVFQWDNRLFLFSTGSQPRILEQQGSTWLVQTTSEVPVPLNDVRFDAEGRFWLGGGGVAQWDITSDSWRAWSAAELDLQIPLRSLAVWGNDFWMATRNGLLEYQNQATERYTAGNSRIVSNNCIDVRFGPDGALWMSLAADAGAGYQSGIMRFEASKTYQP